MLPQQQPLPPLACMAHWLDALHIFPSAIFPLFAIMGHFMPVWLPDIMAHFPSLQQSVQTDLAPPSALPWLQQAQAFESGVAGDAVGVAVWARDVIASARMMIAVLSFM
jgi:hypothetical protein